MGRKPPRAWTVGARTARAARRADARVAAGGCAAESDPPAARSGPAGWRFAAGLTCAFAVLTAPLLTRPFDAVVSHWDADIDHSLWAQWWFARCIAGDPAELLRTDRIAYPHVVSLALADLNLAVDALAWPWQRGLGAAAAYNVLLLLSFLASGLLMAALARRLGAAPPLARLCGLLFAGSPCWAAAMTNGWGSLVHVWVLPLVFLALHGALVRPLPGRFAAFGAALGLSFHVTPYYFLYATVLLACFALLRGASLPSRLRGHTLRCTAAAALPLVLLVAPRALAMLDAGAQPLDVHHGPQNTALAASVAGLFLPLFEDVADRVPRVGFVVPFLGWTLLAGVLAGLATSPQRRRALPWCVCAALSALLALGPRLMWVAGHPTDLPLPAHWLQQLPGFALTTNHWRWAVPAVFSLVGALAIVGGDLARRLWPQRRDPLRRLAGLALAGYLLEVLLVWPLPLRKPLWEVRPSPIAWLLRERDDVHVVVDRTPRPKLNQSVHGKALALGWLPRLDHAVRVANERLAAECRGPRPDCLARHGIDAVVLDDERALLIRRVAGGAVAEELRVSASGAASPPRARE